MKEALAGFKDRKVLLQIVWIRYGVVVENDNGVLLVPCSIQATLCDCRMTHAQS